MNPPSPLYATLLVALGGGLGAALRFQAGRFIGALAGINAAFPWATFAINFAGSLAMGLLAGWLAKAGTGGAATGGEAWRLLLGVGVLGGFTTFSAFSLEMALMIEKGLLALAAGYAVLSVAMGVVGLFTGLALMRSAA